MTKKNKGKVIPMLSPENYIRTKARSLPIYECVINANWEETKSALVTVARKHSNGNITAGYYYIDLMCLGVKDTYYVFNNLDIDYESAKIEMYEDFGREKIDYALAHNIAYASIEFAEEYGFKPHKDFTSITKFVLEEDSDKIDLIEIECGHNGKPLYLRGPFDDEHKVNQIKNQLEKTAGQGKYFYVEDEDVFDEGEFDEEQDDEEFDQITQEDADNFKNDFLTLYPRFHKLKKDELQQLLDATNFLFEQLTDPDLYDKYYDIFGELLEMEFDVELLPDELFGLTSECSLDRFKLERIFYDILSFVVSKPKKARKLWESFKNQVGDVVSVYYLELMILLENDPEIFENKLEEYFLKFPDYPLISILYQTKIIRSSDANEVIPDEMLMISHFYPDSEIINVFEYSNFLAFLLTAVLQQKKPSMLDAFHAIIDEVEIAEHEKSVFYMAIIIAKTEAVAKNLNLKTVMDSKK